MNADWPPARTNRASVTDWPARSFTLRSTGARPLTVNAVAGMHRQAWAKHTKAIRETWGWKAKAEHIPRLSRITVSAYPLHADRRSPQDVSACAPEVKAAIDGLVDAGVIAGDDPTHVVRVAFLPPVVCGEDGLELVITEVA